MKKLDLEKYWLVDCFVDKGAAEQCFYHLLKYYSKPQRCYHNLDHLKALFVQWEKCQDALNRPTLVAWAIFYHDVIYDVQRKDNELASAQYAQEDLRQTDLAPSDKSAIITMILATERHLPPVGATNDLLYFLDFDLCVLGAERAQYRAYAQKIRKEYAMYPDEIYFPGRKRILERLLNRKQLFQTKMFRQEYEEQARANVLEEMRRLCEGETE